MRIKSDESRELESELRKRVSGEVRFDTFSKVLYSTDASIYQMEPVGVVIPKHKDDVLAVVDVANRNNVPIVPRGSGTSLAGQAVNHAIVIDFTKSMHSIIEVNPEESWAKVEPGVILDQLNRHLLPYGLHYAPDPSTSNRASIGGGIGNNSCGSHSILYGKTSDQVKEVNVVLSDATEASFRSIDKALLQVKSSGDNLESKIYQQVLHVADQNRGEVLARYPKIMRRVSGYNLDQFLSSGPTNLTQMVVGSEGTLCIVTEAKVNLVPRPKATGIAVVHFKDLISACEATTTILEHQPSAVELVGKMLLDRTRESVGFARNMTFINGEPGTILIVEFYGDSQAEVSSKITNLKETLSHKKLGYDCVALLDKASQANVWAIRKAGLGLLMSIRGDAKPIPFVEDTAVNPDKLGEFVRRFDEIVKAHDTEAGYYGHASVGCLHIRPLVSLKSQAGIKTMVSISSEIGNLVKEYGGSFSGEHGDGIVRGVWTEKMFGHTLYRAFQKIKEAFDPQGLMNPGKIIDCPPMTANLRYGAGYKAIPLTTQLDFSSDQGLSGAVDMCNGMGACRKVDGVMCPSYMVTREEEHTTRGRANLLRAVLSGALPSETLTSHRLHKALDLCLECKGCKGECPSSVDMAKIKYEFLHGYNKAHGVTIRSRIFANINLLSQIGCRFAPFSNWGSKLPGVRQLMDRLLSIHPKRPLPSFARRTFPAWFKTHVSIIPPTKGPVVLFNDTFMNYNTPQVGIAAVEVLEKAGYEVILANGRCCGRPMISKGLLDEAKVVARHNVNILSPYVKEGIPVVGCEPSCLLTLRDEYPDLLRDQASKDLAANSLIIDEFLDLLNQQSSLDLEFSDSTKKILFHGHCHQKALVGTTASLRTLRLPPN